MRSPVCAPAAPLHTAGPAGPRATACIGPTCRHASAALACSVARPELEEPRRARQLGHPRRGPAAAGDARPALGVAARTQRLAGPAGTPPGAGRTRGATTVCQGPARLSRVLCRQIRWPSGMYTASSPSCGTYTPGVWSRACAGAAKVPRCMMRARSRVPTGFQAQRGTAAAAPRLAGVRLSAERAPLRAHRLGYRGRQDTNRGRRTLVGNALSASTPAPARPRRAPAARSRRWRAGRRARARRRTAPPPQRGCCAGGGRRPGRAPGPPRRPGPRGPRRRRARGGAAGAGTAAPPRRAAAAAGAPRRAPRPPPAAGLKRVGRP